MGMFPGASPNDINTAAYAEFEHSNVVEHDMERLLQSPYVIEDLKAVLASLDEEIETRICAKKNAELVENKRLFKAKIKSLEEEN
ncbi:hypothetical protein WAI453_001305 [Rhynchosporium graminicola]